MKYHYLYEKRPGKPDRRIGGYLYKEEAEYHCTRLQTAAEMAKSSTIYDVRYESKNKGDPI